MDKIIIISYSQSPLIDLMPYFSSQDNIQVLDEKVSDLTSIECEELWIDAYIDLYDPRLENPDYLYQFFARIHKICDQSKISKIRMLQNYPHTTTYPLLKKVFYLYHSFVSFFPRAYGVYPIFVPDILDKSYRYHPYNQLKYSQSPILWANKSLFRIIHKNDIATNLLTYTLNNEPVIIGGLKVSILDLHERVSHIFGKKDSLLDDAYDIIIDDTIKGQILSEINYNLESICINQL